MAYIEDMRTLCESRATNPEWPLELLKSITREYKSALADPSEGFDTDYVLQKLQSLSDHTRWLHVAHTIKARG